MSVQRERVAVVLLGLLGACEKGADEITAEPAGSAAQAAQAADKTKTKPASSVGAEEVSPKPAGSEKAGSCAPGGCAPGKCGANK
jgi:hypothetical protein